MIKYLIIGWISINSFGMFAQIDSTWNHSIMEADIVVKMNVTQTYYITDGGIFDVEVIEVIQGNCNRKKNKLVDEYD